MVDLVTSTRLDGKMVRGTYTARFAFPAFDLPAKWVQFQAAALGRFRRFEMKLADIKIESATANPSDFSVACWILNYAAVIRFRLDGIECWSNSLKVLGDQELATQIIQEAIEVLRLVTPHAKLSMHSVTLEVEGFLHERTTANEVAKYVLRTPGDDPTFNPSGVSFVHEFSSGQGRGSVVLEASMAIPSGTLVRFMTEHADVASPKDAVDRAAEFIEKSLSGLSLELKWEA